MEFILPVVEILGLKETVEATIEILRLVADIIEKIAKILGLVDENESVEKIGDKVLQAEEQGIIPENFDTFDEYMKVISEFKLNPSKSRDLEEENKLNRGIEILNEMIEEKLDIKISEFLKEMYTRKEFFTLERVQTYIEIFSEEGINLGNVSKYLNGEITDSAERRKIDSLMVEAEKKLDPQKSEEEIGNIIDEQLAK